MFGGSHISWLAGGRTKERSREKQENMFFNSVTTNNYPFSLQSRRCNSQLSVVFVTRAHVLTTGSVRGVVLTRPALATCPRPALRTRARAVRGVARAAVATVAVRAAVQAELAVRALLLALEEKKDTTT